MKTRFWKAILCLVLAVATLSSVAHADIGPKPSVNIAFTYPTGEVYYATLLSERESTGPASAWDGTEKFARYHEGDEDYEIWRAFVEYEDDNGWYFLQEFWNCTETDELRWTYYPPDPFKILLYFPESGEFYVSPVYERYAFDSYYAVDLRELEVKGVVARPSYDYTWELVSLAARILATISIELGMAWLFGYRDRCVLGFFAAVNAVTQVGLNVTLNIINFSIGSMGFTFWFVILELVVFIAESVVYRRLLPRRTEKVKAPVGYAFVANTVSFALGLGIAHWMPGIF